MLTVPNVALAVAAVLMLAVVVVVVALCRSAARNTEFDAPAATAMALLQPDAGLPAEPDDEEVAAAVDALLADLFPTIRPAAPEES